MFCEDTGCSECRRFGIGFAAAGLKKRKRRRFGRRSLKKRAAQTGGTGAASRRWKRAQSRCWDGALRSERRSWPFGRRTQRGSPAAPHRRTRQGLRQRFSKNGSKASGRLFFENLCARGSAPCVLWVVLFGANGTLRAAYPFTPLGAHGGAQACPHPFGAHGKNRRCPCQRKVLSTLLPLPSERPLHAAGEGA